MRNRLRPILERAHKGPPVEPLWARLSWFDQVQNDNRVLLEIAGELAHEIQVRDEAIIDLELRILRLEKDNRFLLRQNTRYDSHVKRLGSKIAGMTKKEKK